MSPIIPCLWNKFNNIQGPCKVFIPLCPVWAQPRNNAEHRKKAHRVGHKCECIPVCDRTYYGIEERLGINYHKGDRASTE